MLMCVVYFYFPLFLKFQNNLQNGPEDVSSDSQQMRITYPISYFCHVYIFVYKSNKPNLCFYNESSQCCIRENLNYALAISCM